MPHDEQPPALAAATGPVTEEAPVDTAGALTAAEPATAGPTATVGPIMRRTVANVDRPLAVGPAARADERAGAVAVNPFMRRHREAQRPGWRWPGPELAARERDRAKKSKPMRKDGKEQTRRGSGKERKTSEPASATPASRAMSRAREFPNQSLKEQARQLYCACCKLLKATAPPQAILVGQLRAGPSWPLIGADSAVANSAVEVATAGGFFFEFQQYLPNNQRYLPPFGPNSKSKFAII